MIGKYRCLDCTPEWTDFIVRSRKPDEDIISWMHEVQHAVGDAHSIRSFDRCNSGKVDLMLPLPEDESKGIGTK